MNTKPTLRDLKRFETTFTKEWKLSLQPIIDAFEIENEHGHFNEVDLMHLSFDFVWKAYKWAYDLEACEHIEGLSLIRTLIDAGHLDVVLSPECESEFEDGREGRLVEAVHSIVGADDAEKWEKLSTPEAWNAFTRELEERKRHPI